jgi:hypothetical protein
MVPYINIKGGNFMNHHSETPEQRSIRKAGNKIRKLPDENLLKMQESAKKCDYLARRINKPTNDDALSAASFIKYLGDKSGTGTGIGAKTVEKIKSIYDTYKLDVNK